MVFGEINLDEVIYLFVLLLIGMGPKIALVPFLDATADMEMAMKKKVANTMVRTAVGMAIFLVVLGGILMRLLHFTPGAIQIAGGIVLLLISLSMVGNPGKEPDAENIKGRDPMKLAFYPLAVPYLLNPAGIAILIIASGTIDALLPGVATIGVVLLVGAIDMLIFRNINVLAKYLDQSRLIVTESIFGVLLAALAVQLALEGLRDLGIIALDILH